ncbi:MAG: diacylglycerol kinase family protein [Gemmatimonadales bacterium]
MTTLLVVNPVAGRGRALALAPRAEAASRAAWGEVVRLDTSAPGAATALVREAVEGGVARIVVVGGDGTLHEAANGLLSANVRSRPPIGIVSSGTGNDYAKLAGTHRLTPEAAIAALARGSVHQHDVGIAWGEYFINAVGVGFDAVVGGRVNSLQRGSGIAAYLAAVGWTVSRFSGFPAEVTATDHQFSDRLLLIEVGIGPSVGGGFKLTPDAVADDGLFDVCAIRSLSRTGILLKVPLTLLGWHTRLRDVRMFRTATITIASTDGLPLQAQFDGELRATDHRMEIRMLPRTLPVLTTA